MRQWGIILIILALSAFPIIAQQAQQPGAPGQPEPPAMPEAPADAQQGEERELPANLYRSSDLSEISFVDQQGAEIGTADDLVLTMDGRISHFVAELDEFQGNESGRYLIPADQISLQENRITIPEASRLTRVEDDDQIRQQIGPDSIQASRFTDFEVMGADEESIAGIEDVVVDIEQGSVAYVALGSGGILGLGQELYAVPFEELQVDANQEQVSVDVTADRLEQAEGFDQDGWPASANSDWAQPRVGEEGLEAEEEGTILGAEEGDQAGQGPSVTGQPEPPSQPIEPAEPTQPQAPAQQ